MQFVSTLVEDYTHLMTQSGALKPLKSKNIKYFFH